MTPEPVSGQGGRWAGWGRLARALQSPGVWLWELSVISWVLFLPYLMTAHGHLDWSRHAIGRDFVNYWTAAHLEFGPHRYDIFRPDLFLGWEHRLFDPLLPFHFWSYPPTALFLIAPLAVLPYLPGLAAWSAAGSLALAPAVRRFVNAGRDFRLMMFAPAVAVNIALGQNGAFSGALILAGLGFWRSKPWLAGALLGLLAFKPQLAILLPFAVLAERRWSLALAGGASALLLVGLSGVVFGIDAWRGFLGPTLTEQTLMLSQGRGPFQWMMPTLFMAGRTLGLSAGPAMLVQAPGFVLGAGLVYFVYRPQSAVDDAAKAGVLVIATIFASPQAFNYDLVPASAAALILARRDPTLLGGLLAVLLWGLPVLLLAMEVAHVLIGPPILAAALLRLAYVGGAFTPAGAHTPRRPARASMTGDSASNT